MTVAEYKRNWFEAHRDELRARGLKDSEIAVQMGFKAPYFSQIVGGLSIGDNFIDKMCGAFGFRFPDFHHSDNSQIDKLIKERDELRDQVRILTKTVDRLLGSI